MPYFHNDNINVLFIHIPKTGGTSLEFYFSVKYNIPLDSKSLYMFLDNETILKNNLTINSSLQHLTYQNIIKHKDFFNINENKLEIITIVRNPYERIISDLFHLKLINIDSSLEDVYNIIKNTYINKNIDNHSTPQYLFITNNNKQLIPNIKILKTESLTNDMTNLGYVDFNLKVHSNCYNKKLNYYSYLNNDSIKLINNFYHWDFTLFGYDKILRSM